MSDSGQRPALSGYRNLTHPTLTQIPASQVDDPVLKSFKSKDHLQKDLVTCDEIFCLYLRDVCSKVNENYYRTIMRFVMLYRECMNEYGWIKRRETLNRAKITEEMDEILRDLKAKETANDEPKPEVKDVKMSESRPPVKEEKSDKECEEDDGEDDDDDEEGKVDDEPDQDIYIP